MKILWPAVDTIAFRKKMSDTKAPLTFNRCITLKDFINRKQRKCPRYWFHNNLRGISTALRCDYFSKKTLKKKNKNKNTCTVLIRIIITFAYQIDL